MKTLVLAEKPSVGKDIARVLRCSGGGKGAGYMEGPTHIVTWALGHLVTLADPEEYDKAFKSWDIAHLPIMPDPLRLTVIAQTSKQYRTVKDLLARKDVNAVVIATDAGREGELVARWILEKAGCKKTVKRLWISSVTDKAIKEGFQQLKDGKLYEPLCNAAKARATADWLVGINATRCLTTKFNSSLSCGRVQTPTLAIIAKREEEIRRFVPAPFYGLVATAGEGKGFKLTWQGKGGPRCFDKTLTETLLAKLKTERQATIAEVSKTIKRKMPPKLYDLTELQRDANKRFGYSPKETLSLVQKLYEEHKVLTYPRTDSRYLSSDIVPTLGERLKACGVPPYAKWATQILRSPGGIKTNNNFIDNSKVTDHHAIIPTEQPVDIRALSDKERKVYDLVVTRFLCVFFPPFEYEQVSVKARIGGETFAAQGKVVKNPGYHALTQGLDEDDDESGENAAESPLPSQTLPPLQQGARIALLGIAMKEDKTTPPAPFNEATLLSAMENPAKYMDAKDGALAQTLTQTGGLGTVATRADIIEKLYDNFVVEKRGKDLLSTAKGRQLLTLVPPELKSPALTGEWEQQLQHIALGKTKKDAFLKEIRAYTQKIVADIKNSTQTYKHDNLSSTKCPVCGLFMLQVAGKKGEMLVCQDRECNERINVSMSIRSKCPHCYKFMKIVGQGEKRQVVCGCGHKEKYENFQKRKAAEKDTLSKRDLQSYLDNQNKKAEPNNNPFAALKGKF